MTRARDGLSQVRARWALRALCALAAVAVVAAFAPTAVEAQTRSYGVTLAGGSGLSMGTGSQSTVLARTPIFLDVSLRTLRSDEPTLAWGGSLRVEVDRRVGVGGVVRAELVTPLGPLALRAGIGVPFFFAPYVLFGLEGSVTVRWPAASPVGVSASVLLDAYFAGSDLPRDAALFMANGVLGVDLLF
jgi:hypothetical protein